MLRSLLLSSAAHGPLFAPDGVGGGAPGVAEPAGGGAAVTPAAEAAPAAPAAAEPAIAAPAAPEGAAAAPGAPAAAPEGTAGAPAAPAAAADAAKPGAKEFAPSLLDEAVKPTADAKPADAAPAKDAAKPDDGKPSDKKEPAAADGKPGDQAKPAEPPAPIEYAFTYPEGVKPEDVNAERMGAFTGILNDSRVAPEAGQKLLDLHLEEVNRVARDTEQRVSERQWDVFNNTQKEWREQVMADPELGGNRHATAIRTVMSLLDAYSQREQTGKTPRSTDLVAAERKELLDVFRVTGVANNPAFLRFAHWAGNSIAREGTARAAPTPRTPNPTPAQRGLRRYSGTTPARA